MKFVRKGESILTQEPVTTIVGIWLDYMPTLLGTCPPPCKPIWYGIKWST